MVPVEQNPALWAEMAYMLVVDDQPADDEEPVPTLQWISEKYDLPQPQVMAILAEPTFGQFMHNMAKAVARADFNRVAFRRLVDIIENGSERAAISATKELGLLLGYRKDEAISVNISVEQMASNGPQNTETIDAEILPGL